MDKIKDMLHGHKKDEEHPQGTTATTTTTTTGTGTGYSDPATTHTEEGHEKKGFFGMGGHKKEGEEGKKHGFMGMGGGDSSSSSSSDEEREGAAERNRFRREKRAQRTAGTAGAGTVPVEGTGEKKHGFFG